MHTALIITVAQQIKSAGKSASLENNSAAAPLVALYTLTAYTNSF
jgi:hypothetical protein